MLSPATRWSFVLNSVAESCGPSDRNNPPIDHEEITPSAASRKGRRTAGGMLGRCGVSRGRERCVTGSGISSAPTKAIAKSTNSATYGSTRGAGANSTSAEDSKTPSAIPPALTTPFVSPTPAGSRRGCRSSSAALAAPSASPVAIPWSPRATNNQATDDASMNATDVTSSAPRATSSTGRRPHSSLTRPASRSASNTPNAYVA